MYSWDARKSAINRKIANGRDIKGMVMAHDLLSRSRSAINRKIATLTDSSP